MSSKRRLLKKSRLYLVVDRQFFPDSRSLINAAVRCADAGISMIQLRDKSADTRAVLQEAQRLKRRLAGKNVLYIINDHVDIAQVVKADGVHVGQRDLPLRSARRILGNDAIIGVSCATLAEALRAQREGADYIGLGPVFVTATKKDCLPVGTKILSSLQKKIRIPYFAIGGINRKTLGIVVASGCRRVAVASALCNARDKRRVSRSFSHILAHP